MSLDDASSATFPVPVDGLDRPIWRPFFSADGAVVWLADLRSGRVFRCAWWPRREIPERVGPVITPAVPRFGVPRDPPSVALARLLAEL